MNQEYILPNLIIPGFPKSGTSSLHDYLSQHPEIASGLKKEPHIYSIDDNFNNRFNIDSKVNFYNFYQKKNARYFLDSSTSYMVSANALDRIKREIKDPKFIIIARDPIQQIVSHYKWLGSLGVKLKSFKEEILSDANEGWNPTNHINGNYKYYIQYASYGSQMKRIFSLFPKQDIYFIKYEVFFQDLENEIKKLLSFLELDVNYQFNFEVKNITKSKVILPKVFKNYGPSLPNPLKKLGKKCITKFKLFSTKIQKVKESELYFLRGKLEREMELLSESGIDLSNWETSQKIFERK